MFYRYAPISILYIFCTLSKGKNEQICYIYIVMLNIA